MRNTWESFCDHSWNPSHDLWIAKNTIRDKEIFYLYDATDRVLLNVYDKSALQNAIEESVFYDPPILFVSDTIDYFYSLSPDARRLFPVAPTFAIVDIPAFLFELFLQGVDRQPPATATLSHDEVYPILLSAFETLKLLCKSSTEKLRSGVANQKTAERCKEDIFHQLRIISLLADAQSPQQIPLFPELLTAIRDILRGEIPVHWNPENYLRNSENAYFTPWKIGSLKQFLDFVRLVDEFFPEDADFETAISRLTTFNEAATTVVSYPEDSNGPQAESVFSRLTSNDFYQLHIPIRAVPIQCLSHLVRCGILDTETPFLNLPCIRDRIQNKWDAGCKIEKCPLLREPHAYTEQ